MDYIELFTRNINFHTLLINSSIPKYKKIKLEL